MPDRFQAPTRAEEREGEYGQWTKCRCCGAVHDEAGILCARCGHLCMVQHPTDHGWIEYAEIDCAYCISELDQEDPPTGAVGTCDAHIGKVWNDATIEWEDPCPGT